MVIGLKLQKLTRNGTSTCVNLPHETLRRYRWLAGMSVVVEEHDDEHFIIRKPRLEDLGPQVPKARRLPMPIEADR